VASAARRPRSLLQQQAAGRRVQLDGGILRYFEQVGARATTMALLRVRRTRRRGRAARADRPMTWLLRLVGLMLMLTALAVSLSRAPDRPVQSLVARWAPPPSDFIELKGQMVHLRDVGPRGDPVPHRCCCTAPGPACTPGKAGPHTLKAQRRVISLDLPGFGLTGPFSGAPGGYAADDYRGDTYARFVLDLLDALRVPRVVLGGNSLGGEIAWRTATLAPRAGGAARAGGCVGLRLRAGTGAAGLRARGGCPCCAGSASTCCRAKWWRRAWPERLRRPVAREHEPVVDRYFELTLRDSWRWQQRGDRRVVRHQHQRGAGSRFRSNISSITVSPVAKSRLPVGSSASSTAGLHDEGARQRHALLLAARQHRG
jgi:pimeloyl-ACP methyl ester carboxylesterase